MRLLKLKSYTISVNDKVLRLIRHTVVGMGYLLANHALAEMDIDLDGMTKEIYDKTWLFVRVIESLIVGAAGWRTLSAMSLSPIVVGILSVTMLELVKQFIKLA